MKRFCGFMHPQISFVILLIYLSVSCQRLGYAARTYRQLDSAATHSNFVKANYFEESKSSWQNVWCFRNASICLDPLQNPGGGGTCCWNTVCQNTYNDRNHCGGCGRSCSYGYTCCNGQCTDLMTDNKHCGSCENCCPENHEKCEFGLCGYGSGGYAEVKENGSFNPKHW